jgi:hypothetical protein
MLTQCLEKNNELNNKETQSMLSVRDVSYESLTTLQHTAILLSDVPLTGVKILCYVLYTLKFTGTCMTQNVMGVSDKNSVSHRVVYSIFSNVS